MKVRELLVFVAFATILIALMQTQSASACSCMPQHPQSVYCKSEYGKYIYTSNPNKKKRKNQKNDLKSSR